MDEDLKMITATTLSHYEQNAAAYAEGSRDHDVSQNIAVLLKHIDGPQPWTLLDFGCGPGRDLKTLAATGHIAVGLDGSAAFVRMAREATGLEVLHQNFLALDLPPARFDGIFANASMQHVPRSALPDVLKRLHAALKPRGVLLASIPRGDNEEGWSGVRYSAFHDLDGWRGFLSSAGFVELEHYFRPVGLPREEQRWLASAWRRA
ncbi:MAG: class I SAM-dependent methyltransferase [Burkholderiaceae bacterium]